MFEAVHKMWLLVFLKLFQLISQSEAQTCVCASENTDIYSSPHQTGVHLGVLSAPDCLPYKNKQTATEIDNFGYLHALVDFHGQDAWVDTKTVYVRSCTEPFHCVCATNSTIIRSSESENSLPLHQLFRKSCLTNQGQGHDRHWTRVKISQNKYGLVKTNNVAFHDHCVSMHSSAGHHQNLELPGCPYIISRSNWGARPPRAVHHLTHKPSFLIVHHGATVGCSYREECIREVRAYQDFHMDGHGWDDIGYSFLIGGDGSVYEGRGWDRVGAHTRHYNNDGLGTCMIGNYMKTSPTQWQLDQLRRLFACTVSNNKVISDYTLLGHRDTWNGTLCPGDSLHAVIETWPHFDLYHKRIVFG